MSREMRRAEGGEVRSNIELGFQLVERYRQPVAPDHLNEAEKACYDEANTALRRAFQLKEILGDDISPAAAAVQFDTLARKLAACKDGAWGTESGRIAETITRLVSPFLDRSKGIGNVLQAAKEMDKKREVYDAYVDLIRNGKLPSGIIVALERLGRKESTAR